MVARDTHGYLENAQAWDECLAEKIASEEGLQLTREHWIVIELLRHQYLDYQLTPPGRIIIRALKKENMNANSTTLRALFPGEDGPIRQACKIAGLPRPVKCI